MTARREVSGAGRTGLLAVLAGLAAACGGASGGAEETADSVEVVVPEGAGAVGIGNRLHDADLVWSPRFFALVARLRGSEGSLKAGRYRLAADASWAEILDAMESGAVVTVPLTVPEGFEAREIAARVADVAGVPADSVRALVSDTALADSLGVPGPTLEGYLFPETYRFAEGVEPLAALATMVERYRAWWTPERRTRADSLGLSEREAVTLASIVEKEARIGEERPVIAGVYHNRLEIGMLLQADPTVQYALEEPKERLLYRDIDAVADDPYNTYTHAGLPPGPIASPGAASLEAALRPADVPWLFFVARPDGSHVFTRTEREHINAKNRIRRERRAEEARGGPTVDASGSGEGEAGAESAADG